MVTLQLALCIVMMNVRWRFAHLWRLLTTADQLYTMMTPFALVSLYCLKSSCLVSVCSGGV